MTHTTHFKDWFFIASSECCFLINKYINKFSKKSSGGLLPRIQRTWTLWMLPGLIYGQVNCSDNVIIADQEGKPSRDHTPVEGGVFSLPESEVHSTISKLTDSTTKLQVHNL